MPVITAVIHTTLSEKLTIKMATVSRSTKEPLIFRKTEQEDRSDLSRSQICRQGLQRSCFIQKQRRDC